MDNLEPFAQLALMAKAKLVFESENTFLSFPALSPLSYPPERLKFVKPGGEVTPQDLADLSEFARITNRIPRGVLAPEDEEEYLWDVYHEVLTTAQISSGSMSASEKAEYDGAIAFLYVSGPDGLRRPGPALTAYNQRRDAHIKAQEEYKAAQFTAESSDDPAVQTRWRDEDEPRLREELRRIEEAWLTGGQKARVEAAQQIERSRAALDPSLIWKEWQKSFIADLDMQTDTNNIQYAITGFSPSDLFDIGSWPRFTLTRDEMTRLAPLAPPELLTIFGSSPGNPDIESVSFEFRSVALNRPWFESDVFKNRCWRLGAGAESLSDGGTPPKGRCPAYISALVFARNVTVQRRQQSGAEPALTAVKPSMLLRLDEARRVNAGLHAASIYPAASARARRQDAVMQPRMTPKFTAARTAILSPQRDRITRRPVHQEAEATRAKMQLTAARSRNRLAGLSWTTVAVDPAPQPETPIDPTGNFVWVKDHWERPRAKTATETKPDTAAETKLSDEIIILAFICKRLPLCPNPDPALSW